MQFFDITDISVYVSRETSVSGIQRVAFEIIKGMVAAEGPDAVRLSFWDQHNAEYVAIRSDFILQMAEFDIVTFANIFDQTAKGRRRKVAPTLERYADNTLKYHFHAVRRAFAARRGNETPFEKCGSSIAEWHAFHAGEKVKPEPALPIFEYTPVAQIASAGDSLVILGANWTIAGLEACFQSLRDTHGMAIRLLVHDLIPLVIPEHVSQGHSAHFYGWLKASTEYCTGYIANSDNTARDLVAFLAEIGVPRPVNSIPLAQKFEIRAPETEPTAGPFATTINRIAPLRQEILNLLKTPFVLAVGTRESRKNYWRLAQAWVRLSQEAGIEVPKLVFAGRPGSFNDDFNHLIHRTGKIGGWVEYADRPTDAELAFLYENCCFTAMVSHYEGWGLPIGESLSFGKTVVVADNSSMPEVGGDLVEYCDANSIDSIYAACRKLIAEPKHLSKLEAKIASTNLRSWDDVAAEFAALLNASKN